MDVSGLGSLIPAGMTWGDLIFAAIAVLVAWILSRFAHRAALRVARRAPGVNESVAHVAASVVSYTVVLVGLGVALALLGANLQPLLAIVLIVGAILVLVLKGVAENFAAGVVLQARHPIAVGDVVEVDTPQGVLTGTVEELESRSVRLLTFDGRTVHVPNAKVLAEAIVNDSTHGAQRGIVFVRVAVSDDHPAEQTLARLGELAARAEHVHVDPAPLVYALSVSPERVTARVTFWYTPATGWSTTSAVVRVLSESLADAGLAATVTSQESTPPFVPPEPI